MHLLKTPQSASPEQLQETGLVALHLQSSEQKKPSSAQSESESQSHVFCKVIQQVQCMSDIVTLIEWQKCHNNRFLDSLSVISSKKVTAPIVTVTEKHCSFL